MGDFSAAQINPKPRQSRKTSAEVATEIVSGSNVLQKDYQSHLGKNSDPTDNHSLGGRSKNGHDAGKCLIGKEARADDVIIAADKKKAPAEKKKLPKEDPFKEIPQQQSVKEENNNNNNYRKEANKGIVVVDVVRPKRQNVTKESESKKASNGKLKDEKTDPTAVHIKEEENKVVEEIRDSVKDVRDILARLSTKEEDIEA